MALAQFIPEQLHEIYNPCLMQEKYMGELSELRKQASWLNHLVDTMPAGVIVLDGKGMVAKANQIAIDMLGEPLEGERWLGIIQRSFEPNGTDGHEVTLRDGRLIKLDISSLTPEPGQLILMTDLTQTRQLQSRIAHMQRLSALGKMVASLAHQVRTPLSAAMLYAANLSTDKLNATARQSFHEKLMSRLQDLESQVNDMLLFAKSGEQQVLEPVSMQSLLTDVTHASEAIVIQKKCEMHLTLPEPDIEIIANKVALSSAISNLVHNAVQACGENGQIKLSAKRSKRHQDHVKISVQDNGIGMSETDSKQIFEPFYTTKANGTGLGLAVVQSVANSHQGFVKAGQSELGGAEFNLYLPIISSNQD
jgi:two-component system sensor histidine kinase FlrB